MNHSPEAAASRGSVTIEQLLLLLRGALAGAALRDEPSARKPEFEEVRIADMIQLADEIETSIRDGDSLLVAVAGALVSRPGLRPATAGDLH